MMRRKTTLFSKNTFLLKVTEQKLIKFSARIIGFRRLLFFYQNFFKELHSLIAYKLNYLIFILKCAFNKNVFIAKYTTLNTKKIFEKKNQLIISSKKLNSYRSELLSNLQNNLFMKLVASVENHQLYILNNYFFTKILVSASAKTYKTEIFLQLYKTIFLFS